MSTTDPQTITEKLTKAFPRDAIKSRKIGGGRNASYIDGTAVIRRLNEATGNNWSFTVDRFWSEGRMNLALVTLTIPGMGSRQHVGVQANDDARTGEDAIAKGSITDALKKAATLFGVGLELYGPDYEDDDAPQPRQSAPQPQGQAQQPQRVTEHFNRETGEITRPVAAAGQPPTERQIKYLHAIAKEKGLEHDDLHDMAMDRYGKSVSELDRRDASAFVDVLQAWRPGAVTTQAPTPIRQDVAPVGDDTAWTTLWKELREAGVPSGNIPAATDLIGTWNSNDPASLLATLRMKVASMPRQQGSAGLDRHTS